MTDPERDILKMKEDFYTRVLPTIYLNRLIRLEYDPATQTGKLEGDHVSIGAAHVATRRDVEADDEESREGPNEGIIKRGEDFVKDCTDVFLPAMWRAKRNTRVQQEGIYAEDVEAAARVDRGKVGGHVENRGRRCETHRGAPAD